MATSRIDANPYEMLHKADLGPDDFDLLSLIHDAGFASFMHGSIVLDRISPTSDVDFTLIGELGNLPPDIRHRLLPGAAAVRSLVGIDYISTSTIGQNGRKLSIHASHPEFRGQMPIEGKPYALEYRPGTHAKKGARKYFLAGTDIRGGTYLVDFRCESRTADDEGGTITATPQTGLMILEGSNVATVDGVPLPGISANRVMYVDQEGKAQENINPEEEIAILGLEFDKMRLERPLLSNPEYRKKYLDNPLERSGQLLADYSGDRPEAVTQRLMGHLANHWSKVKDGKPR